MKKQITSHYTSLETIQLLFQTFFNILNNKQDI